MALGLQNKRFYQRWVNGVDRGGGQAVLTIFRTIRLQSGHNLVTIRLKSSQKMVKVQLTSGRHPLKSCVFRGASRTPTGLKGNPATNAVKVQIVL